MNVNEFNNGVLRSETDSTVTLDVRPFEQRQGEAIDSYLHDVGMALQGNAFPHNKRILLICDSAAGFASTTAAKLARIQQLGVDIEIQRAHS